MRRQEEKLQLNLQSWIDDLFWRALEWVLANAASWVVDTTKAGVVHNALSHLVGAKSKGEFVCGAVRGFGSNLLLEKRAELAKQIYSWGNETPADHRRPLDGKYDAASGQHVLYSLDDSTTVGYDELMASADGGAAGSIMVRTPGGQRDEDMLSPWLSRSEPFVLVGPEGAGKNMLLSRLFAAQRGTQVAVVHCSAQTLSTHVIHKLSQQCLVSQTQSGRLYRPKDAARLVLYLKDINLPKPDKYETAELVAFLQQLVTYKGFYDKSLDFIELQNIQLVASMNPSTTVGRYPLSTRFTANARLAYVAYPEKEALFSVYTQLVGAVLRQKCQGAAMWEGLAAAKKLAGATVELYEALRKKFSVDEQRHYLFTPRDLTQWIVGLARYDLNEGGTSVLDMWAAEGSQQLRARLVSAQHHAKFDALVSATLKGHFDYTQDDKQTGALYSALMMGAADRAGAAPDRALTLKRASAAEVEKVVAVGLKAYEREVKELGLLLFPEALRHIVAMDRVLSRPGGNLLLVGASGVGRRSLLSLACHLHGLELVSPSMVRDYSLRSFCAELKVALPKAGVTGTPTCLLLEDHMLRDTPVIEAVNSLLAAGEIPGLFEPQELEPMLAPLKEEFGQQGFKYRTLFDFFVARVQKFLHLALSMDPSSPTFLLRCESNPALYTRCTMLWMGQLT